MMNLISTIMIVSGLVSADGAPLNGQEVMLVNQKAEKVLAVSHTDDNGHYSLKFSDTGSYDDLYLLAKIRTKQIVTVEAKSLASVDLKQDLNFSILSKDLVAINGEVIAKTMTPILFDLTINLKSVAGISQELVPMFNMVSEKSKFSRFCTLPDTGDKFQILLKPGIIAIGGERIYAHQAMPTEPLQNFICTQVEKLPKCEKLKGNIYLGYDLEVKEPVKLEMLLEPYMEE